MRTKSQKEYQISSWDRGQSGHQTITSLGCPLCDSLENYRLAPGAEREDPCFFKMLLVFFLYFCLSFVILMDNLTTKSPVTRKEIAWKAKTITEKQPFEFSTYHGLCPMPLSLLQAHILDLSSPGISRTSWILRVFNKFFVFESFCRTVCETLPILGFASSTLFITRLPSFIGFSFGWLFTFWHWTVLVHLNEGDDAECEGGSVGAAGAPSWPRTSLWRGRVNISQSLLSKIGIFVMCHPPFRGKRVSWSTSKTLVLQF